MEEDTPARLCPRCAAITVTDGPGIVPRWLARAMMAVQVSLGVAALVAASGLAMLLLRSAVGATDTPVFGSPELMLWSLALSCLVSLLYLARHVILGRANYRMAQRFLALQPQAGSMENRIPISFHWIKSGPRAARDEPYALGEFGYLVVEADGLRIVSEYGRVHIPAEAVRGARLEGVPGCESPISGMVRICLRVLIDSLCPRSTEVWTVELYLHVWRSELTCVSGAECLRVLREMELVAGIGNVDGSLPWSLAGRLLAG